MNQNHVIDSWIAELGLGARKIRRSADPPLGPAGVALEAARPVGDPPPAPLARRDYRPLRRPRYRVISSPC
jgi:hypothetical protein